MRTSFVTSNANATVTTTTVTTSRTSGTIIYNNPASHTNPTTFRTTPFATLQNSDDDSGGVGSRNCIMFNLKIVILCIIFSYYLNDSTKLFTQQDQQQHQQQRQQHDLFLSTKSTPTFHLDHQYCWISSTPSLSTCSTYSTMNMSYDINLKQQHQQQQQQQASTIRHHKIFLPFTYLNNTSFSPSAIESLLTLQYHFQSFYNQNNIPSQTLSLSMKNTIGNVHQNHNMNHLFPLHYDIARSTEDNYKLTSKSLSSSYQFHGRYKDIRSTLDYKYHSNYIPSRQLLQDEIIQYILRKNTCCSISSQLDSKTNHNNNKSKSPWMLFTAGAMGAGKSYTIKYLHSQNRFPLSNFVIIDPDEIRHLLPEYQYYIQQTDDTVMMEQAGIYTRKESGYICEILVQIALRNGCNVLMDGSLQNYQWYIEHFQSLRSEFGVGSHNTSSNNKGIQIGIIHIKAPKDAVLERAKMRSKITKRIVPNHVLEESIEMVPKSVKILSKYVDFFVELYNGPGTNDIEIMTEGMTWDTFRAVFYDESNGYSTNSNECNKTTVSSISSSDNESKSIEQEIQDASNPPYSVHAGLKVDKELDYQLLRLLSKL